MYKIFLSRPELNCLLEIAAEEAWGNPALEIPYLFASRKLSASIWDREQSFTPKEYEALKKVVNLGAKKLELTEEHEKILVKFNNLEIND